MELTLGTVQFGLAYGIAGRKEPIGDSEARALLVAAARHGVKWLDTASVYGNIEVRLASLCEGLHFHVVSKLPPLPAGTLDKAAQRFFVDALCRSRDRLGSRLRVLLFHRPSDLLGHQGDGIWAALQSEAAHTGIRLGVSCYDVTTLHQLQARFPLDAAQIPGNAFDQAPATIEAAKAPPLLQIRSAFLQGLLLMPEKQANRRLPVAALALRRWHAWCETQGIDPLEAALSIVKGFPAADQCVVGVDGPDHLNQIASCWTRCQPMHAPELACDETAITDPREWRLAA